MRFSFDCIRCRAQTHTHIHMSLFLQVACKNSEIKHRWPFKCVCLCVNGESAPFSKTQQKRDVSLLWLMLLLGLIFPSECSMFKKFVPLKCVVSTYKFYQAYLIFGTRLCIHSLLKLIPSLAVNSFSFVH